MPRAAGTSKLRSKTLKRGITCTKKQWKQSLAPSRPRIFTALCEFYGGGDLEERVDSPDTTNGFPWSESLSKQDIPILKHEGGAYVVY